MAKQNLKIGFLADPINQFDSKAETTFFLMHQAQKEKAAVFIGEIHGLFFNAEKLWFKVQKVELKKRAGQFSYRLGAIQEKLVEDFDVLFLRKDPPVNKAYFEHLAFLALAKFKNSKKPLMINNPQSLLFANEKLSTQLFQSASPKTLVSSNYPDISAFIKKQKKVVIKPLNEAGGRGIYQINWGDPNQKELICQQTNGAKTPIIVQKFLPEVKKGDKRVLLFDGEILGSFLRVPAPHDFRGNMHQGATWQKTTVSPKQLEIVDKIKGWLKEQGLYFVGLDFIGDKLTEINATSPMGLRELTDLYQIDAAQIIFKHLRKLI